MRFQNKQRRFNPMKKGELRELYQMMFPEYPDIVTVKELREMLGISRKLAYKLIDYGYIHAVKIGTTLKIPKISVINYVMEKEVKNVYLSYPFSILRMKPSQLASRQAVSISSSVASGRACRIFSRMVSSKRNTS